jgi:hypothetical protein
LNIRSSSERRVRGAGGDEAVDMKEVLVERAASVNGAPRTFVE